MIGRAGQWLAVIGLLILAALPSPARSSGQEAWLVSYGPGQEVWERFGHNAIWLRDAGLNLDHVYSFGYFDIDRPGFHLDFARGIMPYYGSASLPEREFAFYRLRDRSISIQRLELDSQQFRRLHSLLHDSIFPIPQYYDYDYFFANCSTWLRDLLNQAVDGQLRPWLEAQPARLNFRDHIRRLNESRLELHSGLMLLLGPTIDQPRTAWEEVFVPDALAEWIGAAEIDGRALVSETRELYTSATHQLEQRPDSQVWVYALIGILVAVLIVLPPQRIGMRFWPLLAWRAGILSVGLAGTLILLMWFATAHEAVVGNRFILLLNPLWLLLLVPLPSRVTRALIWLLAASAVVGAAVLGLPWGAQYRPELLIGLLPILAALLLVTKHRGRISLPRPSSRPATRPGAPRSREQ